MSWFYLIIAGLLECVWAISMKYSDGFTRLSPSLVTLGAMVVSFYCLSLALKDIPLGTAYAIWTGTGAAGVAIAGMFLFDDARDIPRIICIILIISGVLGLKLFSSNQVPS